MEEEPSSSDLDTFEEHLPAASYIVYDLKRKSVPGWTQVDITVRGTTTFAWTTRRAQLDSLTEELARTLSDPLVGDHYTVDAILKDGTGAPLGRESYCPSA